MFYVQVILGFGRIRYLSGWEPNGAPILSDRPATWEDYDSAHAQYCKLYNRLSAVCQTTFRINILS